VLSRSSNEPSQFIPGKPAQLWQAAAAGETRAPGGMCVSANVTLSRAFAAKVDEMLTAGALRHQRIIHSAYHGAEPAP
jgi:hypothetical protein